MSEPSRLARLYKQACLAEIEALKPGNVHIFADGHGMTVQDFIRSAEASADKVAAPGMAVGRRIFDAVDATWQAVGCNTNLGILLLCAPLLKAAEQASGAGLPVALRGVLAGLTVEDAKHAFRAIVRAAPAGLGNASDNDVRNEAQVTLLKAMEAAQARDRVAGQYATGFADIFDAVRFYEAMLAKWQRPAWVTTAVYLHFLATFEDSHLLRKYGVDTAAEVMKLAQRHHQTFIALDNPKTYMRPLLDLDAEFKNRGLNPGTSADLTVATLLAAELMRA